MADKYSISIWKDIPKIDDTTKISYIGEERVANIGSDTMTSPNRALNPQLSSNINGTNTFTFQMYYSYIDTKTGEKKKNPFTQIISNETKIKVFWKEQWYDFIVKNIQESSNGKTIQYTCNDLFINELSKTGFNLEFDAELDNNQGTVQELAKKVLDGSDWSLENENNWEIIKQEIEEPVYELSGIEIVDDFFAKNSSHKIIKISKAATILLYYSILREQNKYLQFFYNGKNIFTKESSDMLTIDGECYYVENVEWTEDDDFKYCSINNTIIFKISKTKNISTNYRAKRLVRSIQSKLDPITDKYVDLYDYNGNEIYKYVENEYLDPTFVQNLLINSEEFISLDGWLAVGSVTIPTFKLYPPFSNINIESHSYLKISKGYYYNTAFQTSTAALNGGIQKGQKYIFRIQAFADSNNSPTNNFISSGITFFVNKYNNENKIPSGSNYFSLGTFKTVTIDGEKWLECEATCNKSATKSELLFEHIGFFINNTSSNDCWIKKVQFYPLVYGEDVNGNTVRINPGDLDRQALIRPLYKYYNPSENTGAKNIDDIKFLYVGNTDWETEGLKPKYNDNFEKIRSITEKNSNRFNLLQTLAETFECWVRFKIDHNEDGSIIQIYDEKTKKIKPIKIVSFVKEIGKQVGIGFKYGIDLKEIQRTINSDQIATKIIVIPNNNEFGKDGFCTIARAKDNYSKENFILNFDYYISHGLLDGGELNKDLYLTTEDVIGYYYHLNQNNSNYDTITETLTARYKDVLKQDSFRVTYEEYITSAEQQKQNVRNDLLAYTNTTNDTGISAYIKKYPNDSKSNSLNASYQNLTNSIKEYTKQLKGLNVSIEKLNKDIESLEKQQKELVAANEKLHSMFFTKYARYIQEGSWISEEYIDDDMYYMDAVSVAYTSSRPQVSYNISVLRLSALDKFKNKIFHLGDISYIEDTDFFGYINGTPYKELVLISEIVNNFENPEQDRITIQNYRTQFEDLFQRITATTQSLQYNQGGYQKAANAFTEDGTIKVETLQNSIAYNQELIYSSQNESIIKDSTGITLTDLNNPNKKTKITSGGVFITIDGGVTWKNAIRGEGLSTQYLTAGSINANHINILDGNHVTFRWDSRGINAFDIVPSIDNEEQVGMINLAKYVRFDRFGVYGVDGNSDFVPIKEDDIWEEEAVRYGLTWKGFFMKNRGSNGWVEVSSENDITVFSKDENNSTERIKIGRIYGNGSDIDPYIYGIRINNADGLPVMENADDGSLWLKKELNISSSLDENNEEIYKIQIGYLDLKDNESLHRTIDINNNFIVYEDGSMIAKNGTFTGTINATGGTIGGLTIEQVINDRIRFEILSDKGTVISNNINSINLSAKAYIGDKDITSNYNYTWYIDGIVKGTGETFELLIQKDITKVHFEAEEKSSGGE